MNDTPTPPDSLTVARRVEELFIGGKISLTTFLEMERQCLSGFVEERTGQAVSGELAEPRELPAVPESDSQ